MVVGNVLSNGASALSNGLSTGASTPSAPGTPAPPEVSTCSGAGSRPRRKSVEFRATDMDGLPVPGGAGSPGVETQATWSARNSRSARGVHGRQVQASRPYIAAAGTPVLASLHGGDSDDNQSSSSSSSNSSNSSCSVQSEGEEEVLADVAAEPMDGIAWLRFTEAGRSHAGRPGPSAVLMIFSVFFVGAGSLWMTACMLQAMPWLVPMGIGAACFALSLISKPDGLVSFFPQGLQQFLTETAVFDLLYDDSNMQNMVRKWGRIMMLVQERPENEVAVIMKDLDQDFVDSIFRRTLLQWFPAGIRRLMLPEDVDERVSSCLEAARVDSSAGASGLSSKGMPQRRKSYRPRPPTRLPSMILPATAAVHAEELTPGIIVDLMRDRSEKRIQAITEKPLLPAILSLKMMSAVATWKAIASKGMQAAAGCVSLWYGWSMLWPKLLKRMPESTQALLSKNFATVALIPSDTAFPVSPTAQLVERVIYSFGSSDHAMRVLRGVGLIGLVFAGSSVATLFLTNVTFLGAPFSLIRLIAYKEAARDHEHDHDHDLFVESAGHAAEAMAQKLIEERDHR